ncbi:MAG TPA: metallopeptidase family protein [Pirellulales bacterium]
MPLSPAERDYFDELAEEVVAELPEMARVVLNETPLVIEDHPPKWLMREMGVERREDLQGLHQGRDPQTRSVDDGWELPEQITIYRLGIMALARDERGRVDPGELREQIRITILHEIGHHFGMDEDDLEELDYD